VVAHSSATTIALQLAVDHPDLVRALSLCEPPLVDELVAPADRYPLRAALGPVLGAAMAATARGDLHTAFDTFMTAVCGPGYRQVLADALGPGAVEHAEAGCRYFFTDEMPAVAAWTLDRAAIARLRMPTVLIHGSASPPPVHRLIAHLAGLMPTATIATIPGADHLMPLTRPAELAALVDAASAPFLTSVAGPEPV
jgi:pimeloyl-ACP methyl ester carboxylesterase